MAVFIAVVRSTPSGRATVALLAQHGSKKHNVFPDRCSLNPHKKPRGLCDTQQDSRNVICLDLVWFFTGVILTSAKCYLLGKLDTPELVSKYGYTRLSNLTTPAGFCLTNTLASCAGPQEPNAIREQSVLALSARNVCVGLFPQFAKSSGTISLLRTCWAGVSKLTRRSACGLELALFHIVNSLKRS